MADEGNQLTDEAVRKVARTVRRVLGDPRRGAGLGPNNFVAIPPPARTGKVYGVVPAATPDAPGVGELKLDKIDQTGKVFTDPDQLPEPVYNLSSQPIADGTRVIVHWDQVQLQTAAGENIPASGWLTTHASGGGTAGYAQLMMSDPANSIAHSLLFDAWDHAEQDSPATLFELVAANVLDTPDTRKQGIKILTPGMYLVGFNATLDILTSSGTDLTVNALGDNLCEKIPQDQISLVLTINDGEVLAQAHPVEDIIGNGSPAGHEPVKLLARQICNFSEQGHGWHSSPVVLAADDVIRLFYEAVSATSGRSTLTADMWVVYLGPAPAHLDPA